MKKRIIDTVCLCLTMALFATVVLLNIFQPNRPTVSEVEQRKLATWPEFSWQALTSGEYFADIAEFISDTFVGRDALVYASRELDTLKGFNYSIGDGNDFVIIDPGKTDTDDTIDSDISDKIDDAFSNLETDPPESETTDTEPERPDHGGQEIVDGVIVEQLNGEEAPDGIIAVTLSKSNVNLTVGSGSFVFAAVEPKGSAAILRWTISDDTIATISTNKSGGVNIKALSVGTAVITCKVSDEVLSTCTVNVTEINSEVNAGKDYDADFMPSGLFIYGDAVYTQAWLNRTGADYYATAVEYYAKLFKNATVSVAVAPVSAFVIDNPDVQAKIPDQKQILLDMGEMYDDTVNYVDVYSEMYQHRDEYLYFKSDHHWTARGAYYAYVAYIKSIGEEPAPLDAFDYMLKNEQYSGTMYMYTLNARVKEFKDKVEAFIPRKAHTMTVSFAGGGTRTYDSCVTDNNTYLAFIAGDNPYTVINVPENPQDKNILVLKDSFGNAFVPFLCENFGNIYVVDVRHSSFNIYEQLKDAGITDILFMNNIQQANSLDWAKMYLGAVGVEIE